MNHGKRRSFPLFVLASLLSFGLDAGLFQLLLVMLADTPGRLVAAHGGARAVSCVFNYLCNRHLVFQDYDDMEAESATERKRRQLFDGPSFVEYLGLVVVIWVFAYIGTRGGHALLPSVPLLPLKIAVDLVLFLLSYTVQKFFVFHGGAMGARPGRGA